MADAADFVPAKKKSSDEAEKRSVFFNNSTISTVFSNYGGISVLSDDCWTDLGCKRKKLTPGSLMKALVRSGAGDANPSDGDQKEQWLIPHDLNMEEKGNILDLCLERVR